MPTYDYVCSSCNQVFPRFHKMEDRETKEFCRGCGDSMERTISAPSINIPNEHRSSKNPHYLGKGLNVPLNIIDTDDDGNAIRVTTISKDGREPEEI